jgi:hypothetical protein
MLIIPIMPARGAYSVIPSPDGKPVSGLFADIDLALVDSRFPNRPTLFRIDSGAACSSMSLKQAESMGLLRDDDRVIAMRIRTASTKPSLQRVRIGKIIVKIAKLRAEPFIWPIVFHSDWPVSHPRLLGMAGVVSDLTLTFDGTPTPSSFFGNVIVSLRSAKARGT